MVESPDPSATGQERRATQGRGAYGMEAGARLAGRSLRRTGHTMGRILGLPLTPFVTSEASRSRKLGLPPGTLVYTGTPRGQATRISVITYGPGGHTEQDVATVDEALGHRVRPGVTWINVEGLEETGVIQELGDHFRVDPLLLEDLLHVGQRPKLEVRPDYLFLVLRMFSVDAGGEQARYEQVSFILGGDFLLTFQEGVEGDVFDPIRARLRDGRGTIRSRGADYLMYALVDTVVDNYFLVLERLSERLTQLEDLILESSHVPELAAYLHRLRRENVVLRKAVWPLREVMGVLVRGESTLVREDTRPYLRDVQDHAMEVVETVETLRDMTQSLLDVHLSMASNRMNEVMKVLTIIATIFVPLTFIVGIYGMNFEHMPELESRWGYPAVWGVMIAVTVGLLVFFRRRRWL